MFWVYLQPLLGFKFKFKFLTDIAMKLMEQKDVEVFVNTNKPNEFWQVVGSGGGGAP